jgi:hypothetical protein
MWIQPFSRTLGQERGIDEPVLSFRHDLDMSVLLAKTTSRPRSHIATSS